MQIEASRILQISDKMASNRITYLKPKDLLYLHLKGKRMNTWITLAGRAADPLRLYPCEVANSVDILRELSWLIRGMAKVELDLQGWVGPFAKTLHTR